MKSIACGVPIALGKCNLLGGYESFDGDYSDISPAERRRLAWHLPDNFNKLPFEKRQEVLEWVRGLNGTFTRRS
jgi:hypothetical protein